VLIKFWLVHGKYENSKSQNMAHKIQNKNIPLQKTAGTLHYISVICGGNIAK
jgi:hypothetical protein